MKVFSKVGFPQKFFLAILGMLLLGGAFSFSMVISFLVLLNACSNSNRADIGWATVLTITTIIITDQSIRIHLEQDNLTDRKNDSISLKIWA